MVTKPTKRTVTVQLNLQQYQVLEDVRNQGTLGATDAEVIRRAFLAWHRQKQKESGRTRAKTSRKSK